MGTETGEEGPPSLEYIQAKDLFPRKDLVKEEEDLQIPFPVLQGEGVEYLGRADDAIIAISNYRLHIKYQDSLINTFLQGVDSDISVPVRLIEAIESRDMFQLHIVCKDSKVIRCHFSTFKQCQEWLKRLNKVIARPTRLEDLFAFAYHAWCMGICADEEDQHVHLCHPGDHVCHRFEMEVERMRFDLQNVWRVSEVNCNYKLCTSYPQKLLVPVWITDKELESVGTFRSWKRIPVVVYRHMRNGAVISRCSQPEISWWGWRNANDEYLVTSIAKACSLDRGTKINGKGKNEGTDLSDAEFDSSITGSVAECGGTPQKLLILDARSYTAAVANRAKGGGCECEEYYPNCEVMFMGMANIHSIRNSFHSLRAVCSQMPDPGNWLSALESTKWLQHLSVMLKAAVLVTNMVDREGRPVLVHCSDGWDRTPQIVALAKILLDPYYRTIEGFQVLVETEWLDFGHKFGDRCGHSENLDDLSEQCPVFLQWLDCVHQLLKQFPCLFEFNDAFLVKLVQHTYSCLYGTFLCNNSREREARNIYKRTCSVWSLLRTGNKNFQNYLYIPSSETVLHPVCHVRALHLWTAVYLPISSPCTPIDSAELCLSRSGVAEERAGKSLDRLPKARSVDNLPLACDSGAPLARTSSDPNINQHCQEGRDFPEPRNPPVLVVPDVPEVTHELEVDAGSSVSEFKPDHPMDPKETAQEVKEESLVSNLPLNAEEEESADNRKQLEKTAHDSNLKSLAYPKDSLQEKPSNNLHPIAIANSEMEDKAFGVTEQNVKQNKICENPQGQCEQYVPNSTTKTIPLSTDQSLEYNGSPSAFQPHFHSMGDIFNVKKNISTMNSSTETVTEERIKTDGLSPPKHTSFGKNNILVNRLQNEAEQSRVGRIGSESVRTIRKPICQSHFSDFSLLNSNWDSVQGLVKSAYSGDANYRRAKLNGCHYKRLNNKQLKVGSAVNGQYLLKDEQVGAFKNLRQSHQIHSSLYSLGSNVKICGFLTHSSHWRQLQQVRHTATTALETCPSYVDDDGLPFPVDAVQQRLRQIEATYKQEVELLRRQVHELQMRLDSQQYCNSPAEIDIDYGDDFTCLRESDDSDIEESLSIHSDDQRSEASWEPVDRKETEVTRWVPDHMASHCFNCDSEFWLAKRRHHCRNCGNVFCANCCHLKLPIPDQQLYDPVLVCNSCYDQVQACRTREIMNQQLKKPIATASS
ncbi:myotubularin-related protein 4 isoform X1 [Hypanus sabinus]|uniref:myotubularin-related protein 4 isoform X1 n=2 Tax=Hypanus sabinus TaxID=79690 RepID=UPI0028C43425|nr:myotubularin-related protein 4 isoform X1 [Hypanus sabinus]XP_059829129.1 myotubularin-related protein 4 isoform X1 [Hypanus sabinus]XP_059829130.1 myotubularin-related protein 4 isoform X1 [Hypanus sabinus]XP_059829131.1 myotubularin-related protein 4 isoform X1 [Hypanus sabinus]